MSRLDEINPRIFRLGGGREEQDGSVSFLVRFAGREQGITGELFVRLIERRPAARPPQQAEPPADAAAENAAEGGLAGTEETGLAETEDTVQVVEAAPPVVVPAERVWIFEDLILEEPRSREEENRDSRLRYDFPPYQRLF
jgi:hypothetical protein